MKGIYLPLMTPFDHQGNIEFGKLAAMFEHHLNQGVHGFYIGGSSSECFMMSLVERKDVLKAIAEINGGRVPLIAHVGAISLFETKQLADVASDWGYQAISATPPFYYGFSKSEIEYYYRELSAYSALPLLLYNIPGTTGVNFSHSELLELSSMPNVIGIKHTTTDMFFIERLRNADANQVIFHGEDTMLVNGLQMGASGGIGSTYNLMSGQYVAIYNAMEQGRLEEAMRLQHQVNRVTEQLLDCGLYQSIKFAMTELGVDYGVCREPFLPLSQTHKQKFEKILENIHFC